MTLTHALDMMAVPESADGGLVAENHAPVIDIPVIDMVLPMPGFPEHRSWALVQVDDSSDLGSLSSLDEQGLRFLVVPPAAFFPDYAPEVGDDVVAALGIESAADVLVLVVLTTGRGLHDTTANLAAPVLVNLTTRRAGQVVLDQPGLPVAAPLLG
ncbi:MULTISPECIES: flagellar assembly protein FliW [Nocardioides]|uniref:Flagellar assembly factor FliW n=1 Tax=Nocardioides soli TaxID=1036020 RepID=A0A7W4Z2V8_9ACTN|nr:MULTISPECIES: flagellar assembly protein FliW [Nocardioides]MBB3043025.1 flagellar assembly factor FliW [Nocardioides soli]